MKRAGIITHYNVHNYGAELQLYGLRMVLKSLGYNAVALQYKKNYDFIDPDIEAKYRISIKSIPIYTKYLIKKGLFRTIYNIQKKRTLNGFSKRVGSLGEYYSKVKDIDVVVVGSDEIFSLEAGPNPWYWGIGVKCDKVISYAASFGPTDLDFIEEHKCKELVIAGLQRMHELSVRDENSQLIVKKLIGKVPQIVCDPVFLYGFLNERNKKLVYQKLSTAYVIVYSYDDHMNEPKTIDSIRKFAKTRNAKIYSVGYYHKWCDKNICCDPLDIFELFANSIMVFTDTFHGSVFSILCNTDLIVKVNGNSNKLDFLLSQFGLENRIVESFDNLNSVLKNDIDYKDINNRIELYRANSLKYLKDVLG